MFVSKIYKRLKYKDQYQIFKDLVKQASFSMKEREDYQLEKLKVLLREAKDIAYYKPLLKDLDIDNLSYEKFSKIELLDKDKIRKYSSELINKNYSSKNGVYSNTSGGSTGSPVKFYQTFEQMNRGRANYHYANFLNGIKYDDKMMVFWGAMRDMHNQGKVGISSRIKNFLSNSITLNTFVLNDEIIEKYIENFNQFKPQAVKAYVHSLYDIAKYINSHQIKIKAKPIIHTTTGPLYEEVRTEIKKAFNNAHVFSFYGSREVSAIATELIDENQMMVLYDNVLVEILDKEGKPVSNGEEGEIVVTTLNNSYMPLIRYRIGDRAVKADDIHTFGTLTLKSVLGRTLGVIHKKDGSYIDGQFFTSLFFNIVGVDNFQLIQKSLDSLILNIVPNRDKNEIDLTAILNRIGEELDGANIQVNYVNSIDLTTTGKIMYVYSEI